ncbi:MAG: hypothetical protein AAFP97_12070 [Pseudomonadota bacterium]
MLRELSMDEMNHVSGGQEDEVVVTATIQRDPVTAPTFRRIVTFIGGGIGAGIGAVAGLFGGGGAGSLAAGGAGAYAGAHAGEAAANAYVDAGLALANLSDEGRQNAYNGAYDFVESNAGGCHGQCNY